MLISSIAVAVLNLDKALFVGSILGFGKAVLFQDEKERAILCKLAGF